jgi:hypothetical protein
MFYSSIVFPYTVSITLKTDFAGAVVSGLAGVSGSRFPLTKGDLTNLPPGVNMNEKRHPLLALLFAILAFIATSLIFNVLFWIATLLHVDRIFGSLILGVGAFSAFLLVYPLSVQATKSRVSPTLIAFCASLLLSAAYVFAVQRKLVLLTHYAFPHVPGTEIDLEKTVGKVVVLSFTTVFITLSVWMSRPETNRDKGAKTPPHGRGEEALELATDGAEGIIEGISDQIHHLH